MTPAELQPAFCVIDNIFNRPVRILLETRSLPPSSIVLKMLRNGQGLSPGPRLTSSGLTPMVYREGGERASARRDTANQEGPPSFAGLATPPREREVALTGSGVRAGLYSRAPARPATGNRPSSEVGLLSDMAIAAAARPAVQGSMPWRFVHDPGSNRSDSQSSQSESV